MHQVIEDKSVYVVEFDTMPELPIQGLTEGELFYKALTDPFYGPRTGNLAKALTDAIRTEVITEPGKYGIHLVPGANRYEIFKIVEK